MTKNFKLVLALALAVLMLIGMTSALADAGHGSIVINNAVTGHTYTAYQIFSGTWDSATKKLSDIAWGDGISATGQSALETAYSVTGAANVADAIPNTDAGAQAFANNIGEGANLGTGHTGNLSGTRYTISDLPDGYYMIVDTYTPAADEKGVYYARYMVQKVGTATLNNKADKPDVEKKIDEDNNLSTDTDRVYDNTANIGDTVTYVITSRVPDMTGYKEYYMDFADTLSKGLTYDANSLVVKIGSDTLVKDTAYTLSVGEYSATTGTSISVHLKDLVSRAYEKDAVIQITYTAKVNDAAVIGNAGNPNTVNLTYSNNPRKSGDGTPDNDNPDEEIVTGITPDHTVKTFVTELELVKVDKNNNETKLAGAVFNITATEINKVIVTGQEFVESTSGTYYLLTDGKYTTKAPTALTRSQYANMPADTENLVPEKKYVLQDYTTESVEKTENVAFQAVSDSNGVIKLTGLKEGTYTFHEVQAPDGYNLLDDDITVTITSNVNEIKSTENATTFAWGATGANETESGSGKFTFNVENGQGTTLPSTGGIGTTIFYVAGSIMVLAAAILLITKRRMGNVD
jgi:fimbrial isopeptide formation D2 family protein/LPXTG-motif cell wall-anchored protein